MPISNAVCPHCKKPLEIRLTAAPPMQATKVAPDVVGNLGEILDNINTAALKPNAAAFVEDMRVKFKQYGAATRVSDKQLSWLRELAEEDF